MHCSKLREKINEGIDSQVMSFAQVCVCVFYIKRTINQQQGGKITQMGVSYLSASESFLKQGSDLVKGLVYWQNHCHAV